MRAWTSPAATVRSTPRRISAPATRAWRSSIWNKGASGATTPFYYPYPRSGKAGPSPEGRCEKACHQVLRGRASEGLRGEEERRNVVSGPDGRSLDVRGRERIAGPARRRCHPRRGAGILHLEPFG